MWPGQPAGWSGCATGGSTARSPATTGPAPRAPRRPEPADMSHSPAADHVTALGGGADDATRIVPGGATAGRRLATVALLPALAVAVAAAGLRRPGPAGISAVQGVTFGLIVAWALSAAAAGRARERTPQWQVAGG